MSQILGSLPGGHVALSIQEGQHGLQWGLLHILTPCCKASAKGGEFTVVCRACHAEVEDFYGWAALVEPSQVNPGGTDLAEDIAQILAVLGHSGDEDALLHVGSVMAAMARRAVIRANEKVPA
jgi:hypothetical protein